MPGMSPRIKAKKGRFGPGGLVPTVSITSPATGFAATTLVGFSATGEAHDDLLGDISSTIAWTSDLDGAVGTGAAPTITLTTLGTHVLTASVTDGTTVVTDSINVVVS